MSDMIDRQALMDVLKITMKCDDCQYKDTIRKGRCTMPSEFENACVVITDAPSEEPLTEEDYTELRDRFGEYVEFVVRDMISEKGERWK